MKITPTLPGNRPASTTGQTRSDKSSAQTTTSSAATLSADDITQAGLQTAQQTLNSDPQSDVDYDKVAQMQAMLAAGDMQVDTQQLAGDMLSFFQK
ncbi:MULTISPECIES: flagellar biosynthesis anti-sigma factor FlgM [Citrobacter]|uniref:Negative regulator of flagellin synthesis n=1 Tax=Citrobacter europaeus TaxID=1914243 RepID=A0ABY0JV97_9ENTR|nr:MULTISPECIES: flagellar biosynthesis anti-sigma factor FlgM [Citrobacter]ARC43825.1 flagellar biosynthesis anti-sigma factor FlgM [Citrobacter braakii]KDF21669.1 flagellar biosynthesis anti-sigma factor FlgM [Citrobacter freundii MGH 56]APR33914.1 flagellar biosynthesis anti-sigma factor FlgM [Citrobacter freundii]ATX04868.1 flagellar biosynthesis anti-sigma factor FlgM [Citrobacter freundii]AUT98448.1 flagellar biosynthesis anti-sigma factor FlgM [Citrobacter freundii]